MFTTCHVTCDGIYVYTVHVHTRFQGSWSVVGCHGDLPKPTAPRSLEGRGFSGGGGDSRDIPDHQRGVMSGLVQSYCQLEAEGFCMTSSHMYMYVPYSGKFS